MAWHDGVKTGIAAPAACGVLALALGFGGFGAWAAMAPLEGAVVAPASVTAAGRNKIVQHLEGGIVKQVLVKEGQKVTMGAPVLLLDGTASQAQVNRLRLQLAAVDAMEARALAERDGGQIVVFPPALAASGTPELLRLMEDQEQEFAARLRKHRTELSILDQQIAALGEAIAGHENQKKETRLQIALIVEERVSFEALLEKGLTRKSQVLALKRSESDLKGRESQLSASAAEARRSIAEIRERIERAGSVRAEEASARLLEVRLRRSEIVEQLQAAEEVSGRVVIRAPASGTVMDLAKYHGGAVVAPGQEVMKIVPDEAGLVVEARIRPQDIDEVGIGQSAWLHFSALQAKGAPPVPGTVVYVSPDHIEDQRTGEVYYLARLEISLEPVKGFDAAMIGPGHGAEVFITTGERTFLGYLAEPLMRTLRRSLRES